MSATSMNGFLQGIGTITALLAFLGICVWAYSGKRKQRFEEAANLPFADADPPPTPTSHVPEEHRTRNPQS